MGQWCSEEVCYHKLPAGGMSLKGWGYDTASPALLAARPQAVSKEKGWVLKHCWPKQGLTLLLGGCKGKVEAGVTMTECESPPLMPHTTDLAKTHAFWSANAPTSFKQLAGEVLDSASQLPALNSVALNETAGNAAAATSLPSDPLS